MKININCKCTVTLREKGVEAINKWYADVDMKPRKEYKAGDIYVGQLWSIMEIFGPFISIGFNPPFETEIDLS